MSEENKAIFRRVLEEGYNKGNLDVVNDLFADNFVSHSSGQGINGPEGIKQQITRNRTASPDLQITIEDQIAEGDKVSTLWTLTGTNTGPSEFGPATGKKVTITGISYTRISDGKINEYNHSTDKRIDT